jgi:hypothetical protein
MIDVFCKAKEKDFATYLLLLQQCNNNFHETVFSSIKLFLPIVLTFFRRRENEENFFSKNSGDPIFMCHLTCSGKSVKRDTFFSHCVIGLRPVPHFYFMILMPALPETRGSFLTSPLAPRGELLSQG